jgi:hypothetical protein
MFTSLVLRKGVIWGLLTKALHTPSKLDPPRALSISPLQSDNPPNDVVQYAHGECDTRSARKEQDILVPPKIKAHPSIRSINHDHDPPRPSLRPRARPFLFHRLSRELDITHPRQAIQRTCPISNNPRTQYELAIRVERGNDRVRSWGVDDAQWMGFEDASGEENSQEDVLACDPALVGVFDRNLFEKVVVSW